MHLPAKAKTYLRALLGNIPEDQLDQANEQFNRFYTFYRNQPLMKAILFSTRITPEKKRALLEKLFPQMPEPVRQLVLGLATRKELRLLPKLVKAFSQEYQRIRNLVPVIAASPYPLSEEEKADLVSLVEQRTGRKPILQTIVDPSLLGGLRLQVGHLVLDGSLKSRLTRLKRVLSAS